MTPLLVRVTVHPHSTCAAVVSIGGGSQWHLVRLTSGHRGNRARIVNVNID